MPPGTRTAQQSPLATRTPTFVQIEPSTNAEALSNHRADFGIYGINPSHPDCYTLADTKVYAPNCSTYCLEQNSNEVWNDTARQLEKVWTNKYKTRKKTCDDFFPLVIAITGSLGKQFRNFLGQLAQHDVKLSRLWDNDTLLSEHQELLTGHLIKEISVARAQADIRQINVWTNQIITGFGSKYYNPVQRKGRKFEHNFSRNIRVRNAYRLRHRAQTV